MCSSCYYRASACTALDNVIHCGSKESQTQLTTRPYRISELCFNFSEVLLYSVENNTSTVFRAKFLRSTRQLLQKKVENDCQKRLLSRGL